jgi:hypothetical protein
LGDALLRVRRYAVGSVLDEVGDQVTGAVSGPTAGAVLLVLFSRMVLVIRASARPGLARGPPAIVDSP